MWLFFLLFTFSLAEVDVRTGRNPANPSGFMSIQMQSRVLRRVFSSVYFLVLGGKDQISRSVIRTFRPQGVPHNDHDVDLLTIDDGCAGRVISIQVLPPTRPCTTETGNVLLSCNVFYPSARHCRRVVLHPAHRHYAKGVTVYEESNGRRMPRRSATTLAPGTNQDSVQWVGVHSINMKDGVRGGTQLSA